MFVAVALIAFLILDPLKIYKSNYCIYLEPGDGIATYTQKGHVELEYLKAIEYRQSNLLDELFAIGQQSNESKFVFNVIHSNSFLFTDVNVCPSTQEKENGGKSDRMILRGSVWRNSTLCRDVYGSYNVQCYKERCAFSLCTSINNPHAFPTYISGSIHCEKKNFLQRSMKT